MCYSVNEKDKNGYTTLHLAARNGHLDEVQKFVNGGINIKARGKDGKTPLELACEQDRSEVVSHLEEKLNKKRENPILRKSRHYHG